MKRTELIRHLESHGCFFVREGSNHTIYRNTANGRHSTVPCHRDVKEGLVRKICRDPGIPAP